MHYFFTKRAIDVVGALLGLIFTAPLFMMIAVAIKLNSSGPVFADSQERIGKGGKVFRMYKFRSMIKNAYEVLKSDPKLKSLYYEYKQNSFKIKTDKDPRITVVGKIIRKTSLDELPQLVNILKGDMSLVGPRAFHVDEIAGQQERFPESKKYLETALAVKPGLTGPWQVSGRSAIDFPERVKLDAEYAKNRSIGRDLLILSKTIPAVIKGEGN